MEKQSDHVTIRQPNLTTYQGWTIEEILNELMDLGEKTLSDNYLALIKQFDEALDKEIFKTVTEIKQQKHAEPPKVSLAVKTSFDFESIEDLTFIQIQTKGGTEIPYSGWSTGTKQVILTMTPLLKLNTDDSIILVDEPERSLSPDIQTEIINDYLTRKALCIKKNTTKANGMSIIN